MSSSLQFSGTLTTPASSNQGPCKYGQVSGEITFEFDPVFKEFGKVATAREVAIPVGTTWEPLQLTRGFTTVQLLATSPISTPFVQFELLIGEPATTTGSGGTYPTGFAGGETFVFTLVDAGQTTVVTTTFDAADQSVTQVANRVNAACAIAGLAPLATVSSGELKLTGVTPGEGNSIATTANATLGFSSTTALGSGRPLTVTGIYLAEISESGENFWVRASAATSIQAIVAGTE